MVIALCTGPGLLPPKTSEMPIRRDRLDTSYLAYNRSTPIESHQPQLVVRSYPTYAPDIR
jgi:hypothetical protein